jgi:hypothetical protein
VPPLAYDARARIEPLVRAFKYSGASHGQGSQQFNYHSARGHGVALVVVTLALFIGYVRRKRREGQPWLFHFILWPAYIGVLVVLGLATHRSFDNACGRPYECVGQIPLYWLPASLVLLGALVWWVEDFIIRRRKSRSPAASRLCSGQ